MTSGSMGHRQVALTGQHANKCLSCGTTENMRRRRYCSIQCRQRLRYVLTLRTGLLKVLNIRNATFYFTDTLIVLDLLPYGEKDLFSFLYPRSARKKPADDFSRLADILGNMWWAEKKRTNRNYLASRFLFEQARRNGNQSRKVRPREILIPTVKGEALIHLRLGKNELETGEYRQTIKNAYRRMAKQAHPDLGGDSDAFRRIHQAYEELIAWAEDPTFLRRCGFPDKWFFRGDQNRWVQPIPYL
ncbi:MAG: J domain-containing protein [Thermodesulfobacteriota bacterium]